ncbi:MAG: VacJ family lipoprotein [Deltaproteobacteria bacterium]|nr:VacJ family lipoprotein [Deltaproteobacteria bacterium]
MKKSGLGVFFSVYILFLLYGILFAENVMSSDDMSDIFYVYHDRAGNKHVTNSVNIFKKNYHADIAFKSDLKTDRILSESHADTHLMAAGSSDTDQDYEFEDFEEEKNPESIPDPLESVNRFFFEFNDRLYFWVLKPVTKGYMAIVPGPLRKGVKNFFDNLGFPIRFVNCLFQGKINNAAEELRLFIVNSTIGAGGLLNLSETLEIKRSDEDLGQTLGSYGIKGGFFINWPFLGPSSLRDSIGSFGDSFLDPMNYIAPRTKHNMATKGFEAINKTSFSIGDYEDLKKAALDPYISVRDAYFQYRQGKIRE